MTKKISVQDFAQEILAAPGDFSSKINRVIEIALVNPLNDEAKAARLLVLSGEFQVRLFTLMRVSSVGARLSPFFSWWMRRSVF